MNVVIVYKWARNPEDALVGADGAVDWRQAKFVASDDDAAAIAAAREIAQATGGELVGATVGDGDASWALARGAVRSVSLTDVAPTRDQAAMARALAAAVRRAGDADVVVMGDAQDHAGVAATVAGELGIPALLGALDVRVDPSDATHLAVTRRVGADIETLSVAAPVLVGVGAVAAEKAKPGMKEQLAARKRPVERLTSAEAGADVPRSGQGRADGARVQETATTAAASHAATLIDGDPATAAAALVAALRDDGVL